MRINVLSGIYSTIKECDAKFLWQCLCTRNYFSGTNQNHLNDFSYSNCMCWNPKSVLFWHQNFNQFLWSSESTDVKNANINKSIRLLKRKMNRKSDRTFDNYFSFTMLLMWSSRISWFYLNWWNSTVTFGLSKLVT